MAGVISYNEVPSRTSNWQIKLFDVQFFQLLIGTVLDTTSANTFLAYFDVQNQWMIPNTKMDDTRINDFYFRRITALVIQQK